MKKTTDKLEVVKYTDSLAPIVRSRYFDKLKDIDGVDPYEATSEFSSVDETNIDVAVGYEDIVDYFILRTSAFTKEQLKAVKSLGAHNQLTSGWVREVRRLMRSTSAANSSKVCFTGKVYHSQTLSSKPLEPWVIVEKDGNILSVHCKCMAGLGESCTHAAALLFTLDTMVQLKRSKTVTQVPCYWKEKPFKEVAYVPAHQIDFRSAKAKKKALNDALMGKPKSVTAKAAPACHDAGTTQTTAKPSTSPSVIAAKQKGAKVVPVPTDEELKKFFTSVSQANSKTKPAILSLVKGFQDEYVPKKDDSMPPALEDMTTEELRSLSVTRDQVRAVEEKTRGQAKSKTWHCVRRGRLTASILHHAVHTNPDKPAKSVVSSVLFNKKITGKAIDWGVNNEKEAREVYVARTKDQHSRFSVKDCGFVIHADSPFMGASPDGIRECECCGTVTVEIKCPYKHRNRTVKEAAEMDRDFCLGIDGENKLFLKPKHPYYTQVQSQIFAVEAEYCDFVVWTEVDTAVVTVLPDIEKWKGTVERGKVFFEKCIIPLLAKDKKEKDSDTLGVGSLLDVDDNACGVNDEGGVVDGVDDEGGVVVVDDAGGVVDVVDDAGDVVVVDDACVNACDVVESEGVGETDVKRTVLSPVKKRFRVDCETQNTSTVYCSCKDVEYGRMICCDNENCSIGWYHYSCEGLARKPKGQWYCKTCRELPQYKFAKAQPKRRQLVNRM